jgi:hypothetical protein
MQQNGSCQDHVPLTSSCDPRPAADRRSTSSSGSCGPPVISQAGSSHLLYAICLRFRHFSVDPWSIVDRPTNSIIYSLAVPVDVYKPPCSTVQEPGVHLSTVPSSLSHTMHSTLALLALAATTLAAPAQRSCSYACPARDALGGPLVTGFALFGELHCTYFTGECTYSTVSVLGDDFTQS